jgi:DNA repair exonuclease SbcCD nuclease subunit
VTVTSPSARRKRGQENDLVIVHSSDLHVDDGYTARTYGGDGTAPLRCVLDAAQAVAANVVLLTGDIFEHNRLPLDILDRTAQLLEDAAMPVVILPGNHDPAIADSVYHRGRIADPENVHILGVTHDEAVHFPDFELEIWGHAHRDYDDMAPLRAPRARTTRWQVVAAHGHYEPTPDLSSDLRPSWMISAAEIAATGADYVALGHWNTPKRVGRGEVRAYYSGSPDLAGTVNVVRLTPAGKVVVRREPVDLEIKE